jgi:ElaB/YqjD/DUF883 family membrane-anchored ribosome-binding protein
MEHLLEDLKLIVEDGEQLLRATADNLTERGTAARERLAGALEVARETRRKLEEKAVAGARATDKLVHQYPYQSIGLAFSVGLLLGVLASRR